VLRGLSLLLPVRDLGVCLFFFAVSYQIQIFLLDQSVVIRERRFLRAGVPVPVCRFFSMVSTESNWFR
jgi:hypothetical protein